jgi:phosphoribosylanthranilate isomerase
MPETGPPRTRIKFCGVTRAEDALVAVELGAWAVGMILWAPSPRAVRPDQAAEIAAVTRRHAELAGVFVNPTLEQVTTAADALGLTLVQLHGQEGPAFCAEVARRTGCRVLKAARVRSGADLQALAAFHTDFHLLDAYREGVPGGTGETFSWELAEPRARRRGSAHARAAAPPVILSGGLEPGNVARAISIVRPFAVDVASGIESAPGRKQAALMRAFAEAVARVDQELAAESQPPAALAREARV